MSTRYIVLKAMGIFLLSGILASSAFAHVGPDRQTMIQKATRLQMPFIENQGQVKDQTVRLTVEATGAFIAPLFIFDAGSGDCPSGCIDHTYWGFSTDAAGNITYLGTGDTLPIWMPDCMERL